MNSRKQARKTTGAEAQGMRSEQLHKHAHAARRGAEGARKQASGHARKREARKQRERSDACTQQAAEQGRKL